MELSGRSWIAIGRSTGTTRSVDVVLVFCWWRVSGTLVGRRQHSEQPIVEQRGRWEVG